MSDAAAAPRQSAAALQSGGRIRVRIVHQIDPAGLVAGGIDTFIRGLIKTAPPDIQFSVVGLTTDEKRRPVGRWTTLELGGKRIDFFPVAINRNPGGRSAIPLSVKLTLGIFRHFRACSNRCDILEFHRFEPVIPFLGDPRPMTAFVHQNMDVIRNAKSDIGWRHFPGLYFELERRLVPMFASVFRKYWSDMSSVSSSSSRKAATTTTLGVLSFAAVASQANFAAARVSLISFVSLTMLSPF